MVWCREGNYHLFRSDPKTNRIGSECQGEEERKGEVGGGKGIRVQELILHHAKLIVK